MSIPREYFETLEPTARQRYIKKLELLQLTENDDPYAAKNEHYFVDDMTLWPSVEYGHIFCYFVERPGVYSKRELMQWKSLDAYEYFQAGHVRTVRIWPVCPTVLIARAHVNPSQKSSEKPHDAWIGLQSNGEILAAHCTCMAG